MWTHCRKQLSQLLLGGSVSFLTPLSTSLPIDPLMETLLEFTLRMHLLLTSFSASTVVQVCLVAIDPFVRIGSGH